MDEKGFIFTADATLALIVVIVITSSLTVYSVLPMFMGDDHEHLEAIADSALETLEQNGVLRASAVDYSSNNATLTANANNRLRIALNQLIPGEVGYKIIIGDNEVVNDTGTRSHATRDDVVTKVKVISGPNEGWMGRAYYKLEEVQFYNQTENTVTTVWNFHNWLQNFGPWSSGLNTYKYWAGSQSSTQTAKNISFTIPNNGTIYGLKFLLGSNNDSSSSNYAQYAYGANFVLNNKNHYIMNSSFQYLYTRSSSAGKMYNVLQNINSSDLLSGTNNFYVQFNASADGQMPWASLLANYTTVRQVPKGINNDSNQPLFMPDIAGVGRPSSQGNCLSYNLDTGSVTSSPGRTISWSTLQSTDYDLSTPFELTFPTGTGITKGSAVGTVLDVNIPTNARLFDAFVVVNAFGGVDGGIVQVKQPNGTWVTAFTSFGSKYTSRTDGGYGNLPGTISLHDSNDSSKDFIKAGNNKVRVIVWDDADSNDYDLVGLESCYVKRTWSTLPIRWDTFSFDSYQNDSSSTTKIYTGTRAFAIDADAQSAVLYLGAGLDTRNITVKCTNKTSTVTLYSGSVPYSINLADYDTTHMITNVTANGTVMRPGNYTLSVSVSPAEAYESGDLSTSTGSYGNDADPELFSGTRISVLYPKFLENIWATSFAQNPIDAKANATGNLISDLTEYGYTVDSSLIKTEALYSGDVPNAIPVRLELWKN